MGTPNHTESALPATDPAVVTDAHVKRQSNSQRHRPRLQLILYRKLLRFRPLFQSSANVVITTLGGVGLLAQPLAKSLMWYLTTIFSRKANGKEHAYALTREFQYLSLWTTPSQPSTATIPPQLMNRALIFPLLQTREHSLTYGHWMSFLLVASAEMTFLLSALNSQLQIAPVYQLKRHSSPSSLPSHETVRSLHADLWCM